MGTESSRIEAELGAQVRQFPSVRGALLWYAEERSKRCGRGIPLEGGGSPRSQADIDRTNATFARIAVCLAPRHAVDAEHDEPLAFAVEAQAAKEEAEMRVGLLVTWYRSTAERGRVNLTDAMQDRMGFSGVAGCESYIRYGERVVRRRLIAAGLLLPRED